MARARSELTKDQVETLRRRLESERDRIRRLLRDSAASSSDESQPELEETAQRATERSGQLEIDARERDLLAEVERALAKIDAGTYGVSEATGAPIPYQRLQAIPWARHDVDE